MAKKNNVEAQGNKPEAAATETAPSATSNATATTKKSPKPHAPPSQPPPSTALIICRNKHWRYISSFHGPWLQLPHEILESLAVTNYNTPRPRPIDPAVFFDLVKIRRLVDDATNLAVRAASGVASSALSNPSGAPQHAAAMLGFGQGGAGQAKLSRERKFRMREQATQKLSKAYHLDEIACSVATMQGASTLEDVATHVLQRNPDDSDAKYVHFFHEKIPSRRLAECTSLEPLNDIIAERPNDGEPLRTRATVRVFMNDLEGAAMDLTNALQVHRFLRQHSQPRGQDSGAVQHHRGRKQEDVVLKEEDQPSSLEIQLLFQRAGIYLTIAYKHVFESLPPPVSNPRGQASKSAGASSGNAVAELMNRVVHLTETLKDANPPSGDGTADITSRLQDLTRAVNDLNDSLQEASGKTGPKVAEGQKAMWLDKAKLDKQNVEARVEELTATLQDITDKATANGLGPSEPVPLTKEADKRQLEARKTVRLNAKRALRDYNQYLSHFEYSPDLPIEIAEEFARKVNYASNGVKAPRSNSHSQRPLSPEVGDASTRTPHRVYKLSELFAATPPADLPPYPSTAVTLARPQQTESPGVPLTTTETLTYHPLLTDALHALLLCHSLVQTSPKELLRHAYMVARLVRLADGYPVFQPSRSPARADWIDVLRHGENWIQLSESWENLCAPAPLPLFQSYGNGTAPIPMPATPAPPPRTNPKLLLPKAEPPSPPQTEPTSADSDKALIPSTLTPESPQNDDMDPQLLDVLRRKATADALEDERIADEPSYCVAVRARQSMAEHNYKVENAVARMDAEFTNKSIKKIQDSMNAGAAPSKTKKIAGPSANGELNGTAGNGAANGEPPAKAQVSKRPKIAGTKRWSNDDGHEYLVLTERANAVAHWVCEAPQNAGSTGGDGKKRKKKPAKKNGTAAGAAAGDTLPDDASKNGGEVEAEAEGETL